MGPSALLLCLLAQDAPTQRGTLELEFELTCTLIEVAKAGDVVDPSTWFGRDPVLLSCGRYCAAWCDTWLEVENGQPVKLERTFQRLDGSYALSFGFAGFERQTIVLPLRSPLVDQALRGDRGEEGWSFKFTEEHPPEDEWLEGLTVTPGIAELLVGAREDGAWRLDAAAILAWARPFGRVALEPEEEQAPYPEYVMLFAWSVDPLQHADLSGTRLEGAWVHVDDTAQFEFDLTETIDLEEHALDLAERLEIDDSMRSSILAATVEVALEGRGTLTMGERSNAPREARLEADVTATLEVELASGELLRLRFEGTVELTQTCE